MGGPDQITEQNLRIVMAAAQAAPLVPPADLEGPALAMFVDLAKNRARPWSDAVHVDALAHYCRIVVLWQSSLAEIERGGMLIGGKPNPLLQVMASLAQQRGQLAKMLGISLSHRERMFGGSDKSSMKARELGAVIAASRAGDSEGLLS